MYSYACIILSDILWKQKSQIYANNSYSGLFTDLFNLEYQLSRQKEAQERAEKREKEKLEKQKRLANTIRERKEKELKDNVKYDWIDSDDDDQQYNSKKSKKVIKYLL